jgi:hypothetical protein
LIGWGRERDRVTKLLELSRKPSNLNELRVCRRVLSFCNYVSGVCAKYSDPFSPHRRQTRNFLNRVKNFQIRNILDLRPIPYKGFAPYLPIWLHRKIYRSLREGNLYGTHTVGAIKGYRLVSLKQ